MIICRQIPKAPTRCSLVSGCEVYTLLSVRLASGIQTLRHLSRIYLILPMDVVIDTQFKVRGPVFALVSLFMINLTTVSYVQIIILYDASKYFSIRKRI